MSLVLVDYLDNDTNQKRINAFNKSVVKLDMEVLLFMFVWSLTFY